MAYGASTTIDQSGGSNSKQKLKSKRVLGSPFKSPGIKLTESSTVTKDDTLKSPTPPTRTNTNTTDSETSSIHDARAVPNSVPMETSSSLNQTQSSNHASSNQKQIITCPICNEEMVSLYQLNQHIDDTHSSDSNTSAEIKRISPKKKSIKMDLFDNNKGFSLSDVSESSVTPPPQTISRNGNNNSPAHHIQHHHSGPKSRITRSHWKQQSTLTTSSICSFPTCNKTLNIKNGITNCRKCGLLFCNEHSAYKIKLIMPLDGGNLPIYDSTGEGTWCKSCQTCYYDKPDLKQGTAAWSRDLTSQFKQKRQESSDESSLNRNKIQKRFIKLTNYLAESNTKKSTQSFVSAAVADWWKNGTSNRGGVSNIDEAEKEISGLDNWQDDTGISNCSICFVKFSLLLRKHHCRLCGKIVCDDPYGYRKSCSIVVPLSNLLQRLSNLNYSKYVKSNWETTLNDENLKFRCCVDCKNALLYDWKLNHVSTNSDEELIFNTYELKLIQKHQIEILLQKYEQLVRANNNVEEEIKVGNKLVIQLKEFEQSTIQFRDKYFNVEDGKLNVKIVYETYKRLIMNIHQTFVIFLQDSIIQYKQLNDIHRDREEAKLKEVEQKKQEQVPSLSKKQIRELREQLMVMNEQKFMVESLIQEYTKARRFDELQALIENKKELAEVIDKLELQLGEFGF
ncbi:FYVE zinc finger-domain-containing protein [Scheffersomyces amazonensis]|uniref:FYVE zinc finger-domain-containing protein n=1 Tax=Scheffersomyces amazonensis TaxID=1078765 RepID=UPI00315D5A06